MNENVDNASEHNDWPETLVSQLKKTAKWAGRMASLGFGLFVFTTTVMLLSGKSVMQMLLEAFPGNTSNAQLTVAFIFYSFYFVVAALLYNLYMISVKFSAALRLRDTIWLERGFAAVKNFFITLIIATLFMVSLSIMLKI